MENTEKKGVPNIPRHYHFGLVSMVAKHREKHVCLLSAAYSLFQHDHYLVVIPL